MDIEETYVLQKKLEIDMAHRIKGSESEIKTLYIDNNETDCYSVQPANGDCNRIVFVFCGVAVK